MKFGESKCAYVMIERGKQKCMTEIVEMNETMIQPIKEDISYNGSLNKDRILSEYVKRVQKYGVVNSVDITSTLRTMHFLYRF